ncbi:MAG: Rrf2 family transcriptional regulator [Candidatus Latescibacterota bacterium]|nr:MAG: Rrf2 family transcriptional regulator [Candidatus Latescibacterota bacterium]
MKLSTRARYALRMMIVFARQSEGKELISLNDVSKEANVSRRYLEQLVIGLKNGALIRGKSGKGGGYTLARPADQIKIRQIVESAIGPINIVDCVLNPENCLKSDVCECRILYQVINNRITGILDSLVLADLVDGSRLNEAVKVLDTAYSNSPAPGV